MDPELLDELKTLLKGDVATDEETLQTFAHDKSIFAVRPQVVVYPKDDEDVQTLVKFVAKHKRAHPDLSLTARAASTCMSGGGLNTSIIVSFMKYFNREPIFHKKYTTVEPGVYYRDFEKATLKHGLLYPAYPSSRELCAMGGIINNNAGGEKSLQYGKAENYVVGMNMVLADGNLYHIKPLTEEKLHEKIRERTFESEIYKAMYKLITSNYGTILQAKPAVSKNSAGYYLWNVYDPKKKTFDLTKLLVGAQGTLGLMTSVDLKLVPVKKYAEMLIIYVRDLKELAKIVNVILPYGPESLEAYDDITLKLALKYFSSFGKKMKSNTLETALAFLPEFKMQLTGQIPNLTIQAEFTGDDRKALTAKIMEVEAKLVEYHVEMKFAPNEKAALKYWLIRRDSFGLLSTRLKQKYAAPFIDDVSVKPEYLPEFLPKFQAILHKYPVKSALQTHVGNGNFHVFPLIDLRNPEESKFIPKIAEEVFALVKEYHGSTSGEHNDGWIRTPYLDTQFEPKVLKLFEETKRIFDPYNFFNPHKKVDGDLKFALKHLRQEW